MSRAQRPAWPGWPPFAVNSLTARVYSPLWHRMEACARYHVLALSADSEYDSGVRQCAWRHAQACIGIASERMGPE